MKFRTLNIIAQIAKKNVIFNEHIENKLITYQTKSFQIFIIDKTSDDDYVLTTQIENLYKIFF